MNSRIDQAIDLGVGAGLMYFLDPDRGERRRQQVLNQAKDGLDQAGEAAVQTAKLARETVTLAGRRAGEAAFQAGQQARGAALEAAQQARERALQAAREARDRAAATGQQAGAKVLQGTAQTSRSARTRLEDVVPAAKTVLLERLATDDRVMERAHRDPCQK